LSDVDIKRTRQLPALPTLTEKPSSEKSPPAGYWSIPTRLSFENIGFSKTAPGSTIKYLVCADCEFGPLGYTDTAGKDLGRDLEGSKGEFLVAVDRVRYD
jgi:hypothetical protein